MSRLAPFTDAAVSIDPTNLSNTFISYYTWGSALGLGLDLTLRSRFTTSLDAYMREMWLEHGRPGRPYTLDDLRTTLGEVTGDRAFADDFFARYVMGRDAIDYAPLLAKAGVHVRRANAGSAWAGQLPLQVQNGSVVVVRSTTVGTPWYDAGVDSGDHIETIDGTAITTTQQIGDILGRHRPGDTVPITFVSRGQSISATLDLVEDPRLEVLTYERAGMPVTDAMREFRADWLGPKAGT
jgi:predicted metalloprotease with PDZ domain